MAIFHLSAQIVGKGGGRSAVAAAAYRHCAKMEREETAENIDYSRKGGNAHSEFALPKDAPEWIADFAAEHTAAETSAFFWNAVEAHEVRKDAQLMREIVLALPVELTTEQNIELVRDFVSRELCDRGIVADWAYHDLEGNPHVHLMTSLRPLMEDGFGAKRVPVVGDDGALMRGSDGKIRSQQFTGGLERLRALREAWAETQNHHLAKHGHDIRVDHRSFEDLGIGAVPSKHRGLAADNMEARGAPSELMTKARLAARENYQRYAEDPSLVLKKITTQRAVFTRHDIAREIHRTECSVSEFQALFYRVGAHEELVPVAAPAFDPFTGEETSDAMFSTRTMVELEHRMVQNTDGLVCKKGMLISDMQLDQAYRAFEVKRGFELTDQQKMVVRHLTNERSAAALVGYAGAGKSTAIEATRIALEARGYTVVGGALAGIAADNLRAEAGVESRTLASWEYQWAKGEMRPNDKTVFVMDEAGMVSSRQMESITHTLNNAGAKMIVLGDARQLQPIQAGAAFRAFVDVTGYCELDSVVRQHAPWMREAAIAFGSGRAYAGVSVYLDNDRLDWHETHEDAQTGLIKDWLPHHQAGADVTIMAHRNKDVIALNAAAREALRGVGGLGEDHRFSSERGDKPFAAGDQILFLQNERSLGVFNGSTGHVVEADRNRLSVLINRHADPITIRANEYNHIDYGYARTIHKEQGNTVDRAFVYLSPTMDAQLSYVALTRHRDDVTLYASREDFRSRGELVEQMTRDRLQDSTALYRGGVDHEEVVRGFAERRGFPTTERIVDYIKANLQYLRERFDRLATTFDQLRRASPEGQIERAPERQKGREQAGAVSGDGPAGVPSHTRVAPSEMSPLVHASALRLSRSFASATTQGRRADQFARLADFELNVMETARELRDFNERVRSVFPKDAILIHGSHQPIEDAPVLSTVSDEWKDFAREHWDTLFAAQWAETQAQLKPLSVEKEIWGRTPQDRSLSSREKVRSAIMHADQTTNRPLIEGMPNLPPLRESVVRQRASEHISARPTLATARDIAGRIYVEPDMAVDKMVTRYQADGDHAGLVSELEWAPGRFGELRGTTRIGIANAERKSALEQAPMMASQMERHLNAVRDIEGRVVDAYGARQLATQKPLLDLSPEASRFLDQARRVEKLPQGSGKETQVRALLADKASIQEVTRFRHHLTARYGQGLDAIRQGIETDPALKTKSASERRHVSARVLSVVQAMPVLTHMRETIRLQDRAPDLGKDRGHGIER